MKNKGFTLIELIIVIAIIGIVLSIAAGLIERYWPGSSENSTEYHQEVWQEPTPVKTCVNGYWVVGSGSTAFQPKDNQGNFLTCEEDSRE